MSSRRRCRRARQALSKKLVIRPRDDRQWHAKIAPPVGKAGYAIAGRPLLCDDPLVMTSSYDPFARGQYPVGVRTSELRDAARGRVYAAEVWYPASAAHRGGDLHTASQDTFIDPVTKATRRQMAVRDAARAPDIFPLVLYSHASMQHRRSAAFLCTHLASHGYVVAALDHSEVVAPELGRKTVETDQENRSRWQAIMTSRVPDIRLLLDYLLSSALPVDPARIGIVGHSLGGWTALAAPDLEKRLQAIVALAPGGASSPKPGILPATLHFAWGRDVPTLYLVGEADVSLPLAGMIELFNRTPDAKQMVVLRGADHLHFMDDFEPIHEMIRAMPPTGDLAWLPNEMRPIQDLCPQEPAHTLIRGLTAALFDRVLRGERGAESLLGPRLERTLAERDFAGYVYSKC